VDTPQKAARRDDDLDLEKHLPFQQRFWRWQRWGWLVIAGMVLAGAAGLFGGGAVSHAVATNPAGSARLEYERFGRYQSETVIRLRVNGAPPHGRLGVRVSQPYLDGVQVTSILPTPVAVEAGTEGVTFWIAVAPEAQQITVAMNLRWDRAGRTSGVIVAEGHEALAFSQFIFP
jgi:hypothetical protein